MLPSAIGAVLLMETVVKSGFMSGSTGLNDSAGPHGCRIQLSALWLKEAVGCT